MKSDNSSQILDQFSKQAEKFAKIEAHSDVEAMQLLLDMSEADKDKTVIDVACGPGIVACAFAEKARQVIGVDLVPAMIEQAAKLKDERGIENIEFEICDVEDLPYQENFFDIVASRYAFHHFSNPGVVLKQMCRVCMPGGIVIIADVTPPEENISGYNHAEKLRDDSHVSALSEEKFNELGKSAGLHHVQTSRYKLEIKFDTLLEAAFHSEEDCRELKEIVNSDVDKDELGLGIHRKNGDIFYSFPISIIKFRKSEV